METPAARKTEDRFDDCTTGLEYRPLYGFQVICVEDDQWRADRETRYAGGAIESTPEPAIRKRTVVFTIILEAPAEDVVIEGLHGIQVRCWQFDVVDFQVA